MTIIPVLLLIVSTLSSGCNGQTEGFKFDLVDNKGLSTTNGSGLLIAYNSHLHHAVQGGTVCDDSFSHDAATVICREMGYQCADNWFNGEKYPIQAHYPIVLDNVLCTGEEQNFEECTYITEHNCGHSEDVFLSCDRLCEYQFFLIDRKGALSTNNSGLLIASKVGTGLNGTVCDDSFTGVAATVICRSMNQTCAASWRSSRFPSPTQEALNILLDDVQCEDPAGNFSHCNYKTTNNCGHTEDVQLTCGCMSEHFTFHLVDANGSITESGAGLLLAKSKGTDSSEELVGTVCDDSFNTQSAGVICNMMGFNFVSFWINNNWDTVQEEYPILLDNLVCSDATGIQDCTYSTNHNCAHTEDIFLSCANTNDRATFTFHTVDRHNQRTDNGSGLLIASRANFESAYGTVCDDQFTTLSATIICKEMGFTCSMEWSYGLKWPSVQEPYNIHLDDIRCGPGNKTFADCSYSSDENCGHSEDVFIHCAEDCTTSFSLVDTAGNPTTNGTGLLLATKASVNQPGTVCDDNFSGTSATVICKEMGYNCSAYWASGENWPIQNSYNIILDNVRCLDVNSSFEYCSFESGHNCGHSEDVFLWCAGECLGESVSFGLVENSGKPSTTGRGLLIANRKINEVYQLAGTVCDDEFSDDTADVICRELGWKCAYSKDNGNNWPDIQNNYPIVLDNVVCPAGAGDDVNVTFAGNCTYVSSHNCGHSEDIFLICDTNCSNASHLHVSFHLVGSGGERSTSGSGLLIASTLYNVGTVCDDSFSDFSAAAICKKMGYSCASEWKHGNLWSGLQDSYEIALDNVNCPTANFTDCSYDTSHNCGHGEDVFLACEERCLSDELRASLVDKNGDVSETGEGLLILSSLGDDVAGTVCSSGFTLLAGNTVCKTQGYSCATSWYHVDALQDQADWLVQQTYEVLAANVSCKTGSTNFSADCRYTLNHGCNHTTDVFLVCGGNRNIARGGRATQIDTGWGGNASKAIDGITNGNYFSDNRSVTHTSMGGTRAWWKLSWDKPHYIDTIKLWNRVDCCQDRLDGATITVQGKVIATVVHSFSEDVFTFARLNVTTSEIVIRAGQESPHLSLAEVQVFGDPSQANECSVLFDLVDERGNVNAREGLLIAHWQGFDMDSAGTVCDDSFTDQAANVICKTMGFKCASYWEYGSKWDTIQQSYQIVLDDIQCSSADLPFSSCNYSTGKHNCGHSEDVFLGCENSLADCSASKQFVFHLVDEKGKPTNRSGVLIAGRRGNNAEAPGTVCDDEFSDIAADVICKEMGYMCSTGWSKKYWEIQKQYPIVLDDVVCTDPNNTFNNCTYKRTSNCGHNEDVSLVCDNTCIQPTYIFHLVDITTGNITQSGTGLLIASLNGSDETGGTVCDDGFTPETSTIICKEMGYACAQYHFNNRENFDTQSRYDIALDNVVCANATQPFKDCTWIHGHNCGHSEDIFLTCRSTIQQCDEKDHYSFYLVDKAGNKTELGSGLLVANRTAEKLVGTVCDDRFNDTSANIICREMGFKCATTWFHDDDWEVQANLSIVLDNVECGKESETFSDCNYKLYHDCSHAEDVFLICQNECRGQAFTFYLVDKSGHQTHSEEGLLIVHKMKSVEGVYGGTVCGNKFTSLEASVICKQMGYDRATSWRTGSKWGIQNVYRSILNNITCSDPDATFTNCTYVYDHECGHADDVFLTCEPFVHTKYMCPSGSFWQDSTCNACARNTYKPLHDDSPCVQCPTGTFSDQGSTKCINCPDNAFVDAAQCICRTPGQYFDYALELCSPCPENTYRKATSNEAHCETCPYGSDAALGSTECSCGIGMMWSGGACIACPAGSISPNGSNECQKCPADIFATDDGSACKCAPGAHWNTTTGSCKQCPEMYFSRLPGSLECSKCPLYKTSGKGAGECDFCNEGQKWTDYRCEGCPVGTYGNKIECIALSGGGVLSEAVKTSTVSVSTTQAWLIPGIVSGVLAVICILLILVVVRLRSRLANLQNPNNDRYSTEGEFMEMSYEPVTTDLGTADNIQLLPVDD